MIKYIVVLGVSIMIVIINEIISKLFLRLGHYTKMYSKQQEQISSFR